MILKKTFSFSGRLSRLRYFVCSLANVFGIFAVFFVVSFIDNRFSVTLENKGTIAYSALGIMLVITIIQMAVTVKRFHDLGKSGWYILTMLIPVYNIHLGFILLFKSGKISENN